MQRLRKRGLAPSQQLIVACALVATVGAGAICFAADDHRDRTGRTTSRWEGRRRAAKAQRLNDYARTYAETQQRFNGERPGETIQQIVRGASGEVFFWDLPATTPGLTVLGDAKHRPVSPKPGKVRIYNHWGNQQERLALIDRFGPPSGKAPALMTSSYRTVVAFIGDPRRRGGTPKPVVLKLSAAEFLRSRDDKSLREEELLKSVARSKLLRRDPYVVKEPAAVMITDPALDAPLAAALSRKLPVPRGGPRSGELLLTEQVLCSPGFAADPLGAKIIRKHGSQQAWREKELAPMVARTVYHAMGRGYHGMVHGQNLDVLVNRRTGAVRRVYIKDLADILYDPAARAASGRSAPELPGSTISDEQWAKRDVTRFYHDYLGQLGNVGMAAPLDANPFAQLVAKELVQLAGRRLKGPAVKRSADYQALMADGAWQEPHTLIGHLRGAMLTAAQDATGARRARLSGPRPRRAAYSLLKPAR